MALLEVRGLSMAFGGLRAVHELDLVQEPRLVRHDHHLANVGRERRMIERHHRAVSSGPGAADASAPFVRLKSRRSDRGPRGMSGMVGAPRMSSR